MTLLHPMLLLWGLLAIPLVLLGTARRRSRLTISSGLLWDAVFAERSWFDRARRPIGLALRVAVLELLVIAAADPRLKSTEPDVLILVLDVSASMQAQNAAGSRFEQARRQARRSIETLRCWQRMALLSAGSVTRIECGLTADRDRLLAAFDSIRPTDGTADLLAAVARARDIMPASGGGRIIVATDSAASASGPQAPAADVDWIACGDAADNVGITRCEVRPRLSDPAEVELLIEVLNAGDHAVTCPLTIDFRGAPIDRRSLAIAPGETLRKTELIRNPAGGLLVARIEHSDALAADNVAAVQVPERRRTRIVLVTPGNRAVEAALASLPGVAVEVLPNVPDSESRADLFIWDGNVPAHLPPGPNLVLAPRTNCDLWTLGKTVIANGEVLEQVESRPVAHVDFTQAVIEDPLRLDFTLPARSLVSSATGDPIYSLLERPTGDVLVLHVCIEKTDLAARGVLPVLFADALRSFGLNAARYEPALKTADMISIPPADQPRRLQPPAAGPVAGAVDLPLDVQPGQGVVGPLDRMGVWQLSPAQKNIGDGAAPEDAIVSQLTSRQETALGAAQVRPIEAVRASPGSDGLIHPSWPIRFDGRLWSCFVVTALALLVVEDLLSRWGDTTCRKTAEP